MAKRGGTMEDPKDVLFVEPTWADTTSGVEGVAHATGSVALFLHTPASGGTFVLGGTCWRLTPIQFALLELLLKQLQEDESKHDSVKGFVSSSVLLCSLPWDTVHPEPTHLKQLVRRLRRRLGGHGAVLESCYGLGYRLVLTASATPRTSGSKRNAASPLRALPR
jgi:hypothetical protein